VWLDRYAIDFVVAVRFIDTIKDQVQDSAMHGELQPSALMNYLRVCILLCTLTLCVDDLLQRISALLQLRLLLIVEAHINRPDQPLPPNNSRYAKAHAQIFLVVAHGPDVPLVEQYALAETRRNATNTVVGSALVLDDVRGLVLRAFRDGLLVDFRP
jgi:hypothetical protein